MYNQNQPPQMGNSGASGMNPKFMMPSQPAPQNMMMFSQGMNRVGMVPKPELPLHLQVLFAPRMPLVYVKPPEKHKCRSLDPMIRPDFDFLSKFEDEDPPERIPLESKAEIKNKKEKQKIEDYKNKIKEGLKLWNPQEDPKCTGDPMKTLFVARISFETSEKKLRKEFEVYGPIKKIRLIKNITNNKARGYAFIEFEHKKDFITAYKQADGKKIDDKRVLVDCERGRTVKGWRPRRFGGGKGETRRARSAQKERTANDKKKSKSRSRDNKKRRSRTESKKRSRSRSRDRGKNNFNRERERDRERPKERDRDKKDMRERKNDYEKDRENEKERQKKEKDEERRKRNKEKEKEREKEREREKEKEKEKEKKEKEKKEIQSKEKMEDEGELLSGEIEKKKKKKKGKEKDRSREKKRSKSPKEKKHKRSRNEKDEDKIKMEIENPSYTNDKKEMGEIRMEDM